MATKLSEVFRDLSQPASSSGSSVDNLPAEHFNAAPAPGSDAHRIGKDDQGRASLLISTLHDGTNPPAPVRLEHLAVQHDVSCRIRRGDEEVMQEFTVITCLTSSHTSYFLRATGAVLDALGENPSQEDAVRVVERLADLFESVSSNGGGSLRGLWSELYVIAQAADTDLLVDAWRDAPEDRYDFSRADQRLEVKSTAGEVRKHRFSFEQLSPPSGVALFVTSVRTERTSGGLSVADLLDQVREQVSDIELAFKASQIVAETLGDAGLDKVSERRFDPKVAEESLQVFRPQEIPTPPRQIPSTVTNVKFTADLSRSTPVDLEELSGASGMIGALARR